MWQPEAHNLEAEELTLSIEPYRCDLGVTCDHSGRLVEPCLLAGTSGIVYFIDVTVTNHGSSALTIAMSWGRAGRGGGPGGRGLLIAAFTIPRLEPASEVRFRLNQFPGDTLKFGWQHAVKSPEFNDLLCVDSRCWTFDDTGATVEAITLPDALQVYQSALVNSRTWKWIDIDGSTGWNEIDLARRTPLVSVPAEAALGVASQAILGALCRQPYLLKDADPSVFESFVGAILHEQGFRVEFTARGRDGGVDLLAITGPSVSPTLHLVQCKRYRDKVGIRPVRELYGVRQALGASKAVVVTPSSFTKPAVKFASDHPWEISLLDWEGIVECLAEFTRNGA